MGDYRPFTDEQKCGIIAVSSHELMHFTDTNMEEYGACNHLIVQNLSAVTIKVTVNAAVNGTPAVAPWGNSREFTLVTNAVMEIEKGDKIPFYNVVIENTSAAVAVAANEIVVKADNL